MPWHVDDNHPDCSGYAVVKDSDGSVAGCHETREAANRQMAALYANEPDAARAQGDKTMSSNHEIVGSRAYVRSFPLEDARIRSGGDGRTVEAYAAVFDIPTPIHDQDGHYNEVIDRVAFNRAISDAAPQGSRTGWRVGVFYNHGRTIYGTPSERGSMPIGTPLDIKADTRGVFTVTRYHRTDLADETLEGIREGSLPGYSFQGSFRRSIAADHTGKSLSRVPRGGFRPGPDGELVTVRRMESSLKEYGPTPFPAYELAEVVGMRAEHVAQILNNLDPTERSQLVELLRDGALLDAPEGDSSGDSPPLDAPSDEGLVPDDSPDGRSDRDSEMARHAILQQIAAARRARPGLAQKESSR